MRSPTLGQLPGLYQEFGKDFALELFRRGCFARHFEFKVKEAFDRKLIRVPIYLSVGSEFNSAALSLVFPNVQIFGQHRCHSLYLNYGGKAEELRDELLSLPTGCSGGMSGSNAIQGKSIDMFGHSGLMGEQIPIAVGAALGNNRKTLTICGDASVEEDYIYPSLGFAATKKAPVLFICEDNDLSILTPTSVRRNWQPSNVAQSIGIPSIDITDDPWLIAYYAKKMAADLPGFINIRTVRVLWHAGTGTDGAPEWNRYQLIKDEMTRLGLSNEVAKIEVDSQKKAEGIWEKQLQK